MEKRYKKVMTVKEFCEEYGIGHNRAYTIVNSKGFPMINVEERF